MSVVVEEGATDRPDVFESIALPLWSLALFFARCACVVGIVGSFWLSVSISVLWLLVEVAKGHLAGRRREKGMDNRGEESIYLRYFFAGQRRQDGKIVRTVLEGGGLSGKRVLVCLEDEEIETKRFNVFVYDYGLEGFVRIDRKVEGSLQRVPLPPYESKMIDVRLDPAGRVSDFTALGSSSLQAISMAKEVKGGWFGIGILRGKTEANHGTLWRTALTLGASFIFTIGHRYQSGSDENSTDTSKVYRHIPMLRYDTIADFGRSNPYNAPCVAIEMGGTDLVDFEHPLCAIYLLGAEDTGLPKSIVTDATHHVALPAVRPTASSYNVATAGAIVMYDRHLKAHHQTKK